MKKLIISIMAVMLFLTGCGKSEEKASLEKDIDKLEKENKELKDKKEKLKQESSFFPLKLLNLLKSFDSEIKS